MDPASSIINRAYSLARTGSYVSVTEIEHRLEAEHFSDIHAQLDGTPLGTDVAVSVAE